MRAIEYWDGWRWIACHCDSGDAMFWAIIEGSPHRRVRGYAISGSREKR